MTALNSSHLQLAISLCIRDFQSLITQNHEIRLTIRDEYEGSPTRASAKK